MGGNGRNAPLSCVIMATEYDKLSPADREILTQAGQIRKAMKARSGHVRHSKRCVSPDFPKSPRGIIDEIAREFWPWRLWEYPGPTKLIGALLLGGSLGMESIGRIRGGKEEIAIGRCLVASNWCRVTSAKLLAWAERLEAYADKRVDHRERKGRTAFVGLKPGYEIPGKRRP